MYFVTNTVFVLNIQSLALFKLCRIALSNVFQLLAFLKNAKCIAFIKSAKLLKKWWKIDYFHATDSPEILHILGSKLGK